MSPTGCIEPVAVQPPVVPHSISTDIGGSSSPLTTITTYGNTLTIDLNNHFVLKYVVLLVQYLEEYFRNLRNSNPLPALPMPESGEIEVLTASHLARSLGGVAARRRVSLSLDFSEFTSEDLISKKCKFESMFCGQHNSVGPLNGGSGLFHRTILPRDLASRLNSSKSKPVLVLDCRPFFAYNANHIQGAVNINCTDRFNRRRLQQGKCSLIDLMSSKEGKDLYKKRCSKEIIVYDDRTKDTKELASDATLYLVLSVLKKEGRQASVLLGKIFTCLFFFIS